MKNKILLILITLTLISPLATTNCNAKVSGYSKMILLYLEPNTKLTDSTLDKCSNANTYVILPISDYKVRYQWNSDKNYYDYGEFINYAKKYVDTILSDSSRTFSQIYIATPRTLDGSSQQLPSSSEINAYLADLKASFSDDVWNNNIAGLYIYDEEYRYASYFNTLRKKMNENKNYKNKKLIWAPYYANENWHAISNILKKYPNALDLILIQPNYYFGQQPKSVLNKVKDWVENQSINGVKAETTTLGAMLEIDVAVSWTNNDKPTGYGTTAGYCKQAFDEYVKTFAPLRDIYPMCFYPGGLINLDNPIVSSEINNFFE